MSKIVDPAKYKLAVNTITSLQGDGFFIFQYLLERGPDNGQGIYKSLSIEQSVSSSFCTKLVKAGFITFDRNKKAKIFQPVIGTSIIKIEAIKKLAAIYNKALEEYKREII